VESDIRKISKKKLTPLVALEKIKSWCAYQERSHQETLFKLYEWGLTKEEADEIMVGLIRDNFLNEERFAIAFAGGKFRIKKWGKIKIKMELKSRKVSEYCIAKALKQISDKDYLTTLEKVIRQKLSQTKESNPIKKNYKLFQYAASRGFEKDLIADVLKQIEN